MDWRAAAIGAALASWTSGVALAQAPAQRPTPTAAPTPDAVPYPADPTSQSDVQAWIRGYLPTEGYVVGAWSPNVVMLVSTGGLDAEHYPLVTTKVLSVALTPEATRGAGWRAAEQVETFACDRNLYQILSGLYYARGDRRDPPDIQPGEDRWDTPDPGATMDTVERAACFYGEHQHARNLSAQALHAQASPAQALARATAPAVRQPRAVEPHPSSAHKARRPRRIRPAKPTSRPPKGRTHAQAKRPPRLRGAQTDNSP